MMKKKQIKFNFRAAVFIVFVSLFLSPFPGKAQLKMSNWYFGHGIAVQWDCDGNSTIDYTKHIEQLQNGHTVSDEEGSFLFYAGDRQEFPTAATPMISGIRDRTGDLMVVSSGGFASFEKAVVGKPEWQQAFPVGEKRWLYIATHWDAPLHDFVDYYAIIDMSLPGNGTAAYPAGEVTLPLTVFHFGGFGSAITKHNNGKDFWAVALDKDKNAWASKLSLVGPNGPLVLDPPIITTGLDIETGGTTHYKCYFSTSGEKLVYSRGMLDFDIETGIFSNHYSLPHFGWNAFSPNCKYLYRADARYIDAKWESYMVRLEVEDIVAAGTGSRALPSDLIALHSDLVTTPIVDFWAHQWSDVNNIVHTDGNIYWRNGPFGDLTVLRNPDLPNPTVEVNVLKFGAAGTGSWNDAEKGIGSIQTYASLPRYPIYWAIEVYADTIEFEKIYDECDSVVFQFTGPHCGKVSSELWNFGDGSSSESNNPRHAYLAAGDYEVEHIVRNDSTCSKWNTDTIRTIITVGDMTPEEPTISAPPLFLCTGNEPYALEANPTTGDWRGSGIVDANTGLFDPSVSGAGNIEIIFETGIPNCRVDDTVIVEVITTDDATFSYSDSIYCSYDPNQSPTILGLPGGTFSVSSTGLIIDRLTGEVDIQASIPGTNFITYETTGVCPETESVPFEIKELPTVDVTNLINCEGVEYAIEFTGTGTTYDWVNTTGTDIGFGLSGTGNIEDYQARLPQPFSDTIKIEVTPTNEAGCVGETGNFGIVVKPRPIISFNADVLEGCAPLLVEFTNTSEPTSAVDCLWSFGDGTTSSDCGIAAHEFNPGTFDVMLSVTSLEGCEATETYPDYIYAIPPPKANFYHTPARVTVLKPNIDLVNISENASSYKWNFGDASATTTQENPSHLYNNDPTSYYITLWAYNDEYMCEDSLIKEIKIHDIPTYYVPNTFTPNGDGLNQVFKPVITAGIDPSTYNLIIFNRWGETMFESADIQIGWDGTSGDQGLVKDGVYVWQIDFKEEATDKKHRINGHVTVLK